MGSRLNRQGFSAVMRGMSFRGQLLNFKVFPGFLAIQIKSTWYK